MVQTVAFVLKGYPRLSETFIAQEILALQRLGLDIRIVSLRHPTDRTTHPVHDEIAAPVVYLPEYLHQEPLRVLKGWMGARHLPGYARAFRLWLADLRRDFTRNRIRRFGQACVLAHELPRDVDRLHFHFIHTPASVTRYAAVMRGLPWSGSAHAKDIWTSPDWEIREKLAECDWLVTCTGSGTAHLKTLAAAPERVHLQYHGLDFTRFDENPHPPSDRDGSDPADPVRLLSVGRAVEKKGYFDLLEALATIPDVLHWRLTHIGGGGDLDRLKAKAEALGIADRIDWQGEQDQATVLAALRRSDVFVLASKIAADGDRDGLPNVLMEAQSQGLSVLATKVSAIPELIVAEETGILVPPGEPLALASALQSQIRDPARRKRLGAAGNARVRAEFDASREAERLYRLFVPDGNDTDRKLEGRATPLAGHTERAAE